MWPSRGNPSERLRHPPRNDSGFENQDDPQSWNAYSYVRNNPLNLTDPSGRSYDVCVDNENGGQNCVHYKNDADFESAARRSGAALQDGNILVNGQQIGTYNHTVDAGSENGGTSEDNILAPVLVSGLIGGIKAGIRGLGEAIFGGGAKTVAEEAAIATVTDATAGVAGGTLTPGTVFNAGKGLLQGEAVLSSHAAQQAAAYGLTEKELAEALTHVAKQEASRGSVLRFIGKIAEVRVNRVTGTIVTVIRLTRASLP